MTQFTKLKKLLDELEAKFEALEAQPATYEATALAGQIAAAPGGVQLSAEQLRAALSPTVQALAMIRGLFGPSEEKTAKLKKKALMTGDTKLYNEKKSAEILAYAERHEALKVKLDELNEGLGTAWAAVLEHEQHGAAEAEQRRDAKATADAEQLVADKAAEEAETIMVEVVDEEVRKAALWADEECKAELRRQYEVRVAAQAVAQAEAEAAAADAAAARAAHISAQAAAQLDEINSKTTGPKIVVPDADTPGFRLRAQVVGEAEPRVLLLERGDAATIGEVKAALGQQGAGLDPAQLIIFAGGRMLQDAMTLRKCRIKSMAIVQVGKKAA